MSATIFVSATCGNPKTPCTGVGLCDLQSNRVSSELAIPVTVSSNTKPRTADWDMTLHFAADALEKLRAVRGDVHNNLMGNKEFHFGEGALPFHLDPEITRQLWGDSAEQYCLRNNLCEVIWNKDGSIDLHFLPGSLDITERGGMVGEFIDWPRASGSWNIGEDIYGNLVFTNNLNSVVFGCHGNISNHRYSMLLTDQQGGSWFSDSIQFASNWHIGVDDDRNLILANISSPRSTVRFSADGANIFVKGYAIATTRTETPISAVDLSDTATQLSYQEWTIVEDIAGNLCFRNRENGSSFYFGKDNLVNEQGSQVYLQGGGSTGLTCFPYGNAGLLSSSDSSICDSDTDKSPSVPALPDEGFVS